MKTKKEKYEYFNAMRKRYSIGERVNDNDSVELNQLIQNHPYKQSVINSGINYFKVDSDNFGGKCFYAVDAKGNEVSFSPKNCLTDKNPKADFVEAFRNEIYPSLKKVKEAHLIKYNNSGKTMSSMSGEWFPIDDIHVDHFEPKFRDLVDVFLNFIDLQSIEYISKNGSPDSFKNRSLADVIKTYHDSKCQLRILSKKENLNRSDSDNRNSIIHDYKIGFNA